MDVRQAIEVAKSYLTTVYADENISHLSLEETELEESSGKWAITLSFSRPWNSPRTRAQEVLENIGAAPALNRGQKIVTIADDGHVLSMKDRRLERV